ncbi:DEAD/DEAH box helicase [Pontibacillus yanchengensis]|uniref:DEAD/DEAH box helicase n=1 Tax=Pontibacillus yanchengensis Y32 TaxID=1385514 RepID=A0A0A2TFG1_9BACI|nr:DEAD/DEAH box helicase [Pontibacillus yanchengensis]KGP73173.1 DEAD/DEAH box helicase [Pontibacillus yanchengensis Y32]
MTDQTFKSYALTPMMNDIIGRLGFHEPTPIQSKVVPSVLRGESLIGQSHTGSGKTHSYLIPLIDKIDETKQEVQVIITAPTRELATQIYDEVRKMIQHADKQETWKAKLFIGGTDKQKTMENLKEQPQIVVGTPGRILDLVQENALDPYTAKSFVVDEADLMLDLGFIEEVDQILVRMDEEVQLLVFSATIPEKLRPFLKKYLENPEFIVADENKPSPEKMEHRLIPLRHRDKSDMIINISKLIQPYLAIIFANRKERADELYKELNDKGLETGLLHGGLSPRERKRMVKDIKNLRFQYIVATDLAARGIDIQGVSHVINADLPKEEEFYIHRVGRTARAGLEGTAINLYTAEDEQLISKLEKRGLTFDRYDIKKGDWEHLKDWNERSTRKHQESEADREAWKRVRKPKKVKPGYKKKMKKQQDDIKKKMNRNNKGKR